MQQFQGATLARYYHAYVAPYITMLLQLFSP